jgi:hypothetical protein
MKFARLAVCLVATLLFVGCGEAGKKEAKASANPSVERPKGVGPVVGADGTTSEAAGGTTIPAVD